MPHFVLRSLSTMSQTLLFPDLPSSPLALAKQKARLPTNSSSNSHPVHRWFNFIAGFSPEFVDGCIRRDGCVRGDTLLDPFSGLSTAPLQAMLQGLHSVGYEPHPFFFDISQAKLTTTKDFALVTRFQQELETIKPYEDSLSCVWGESALAFLQKLLPEEHLRQLASALVQEQSCREGRLLRRLIVSRALEASAGSQTDGIYKAPTSKKKSIPLSETVARVCAEIRQDMQTLPEAWDTPAVIHPSSSESMATLPDESISICVTSPPYLNNFDFAEMTRMELYFWRYASNWHEITERVRRRLIVNTTTAPADLKARQSDFAALLPLEFLANAEEIIVALKEQSAVRLGKKDYYRLVIPYFAQMRAVFAEVRRVLRRSSLINSGEAKS